MANCTNNVQMSSKRFNIKYVFIFIILVSVFSLTVYFGSLYLSAPSESSKPSENYASLTIALYQTVPYTHGNTLYEFSYLYSGERNLLRVVSGGVSENHVAVPGTSPDPFDLKVTIYSANERMVVIHILRSDS